MGAAGLTGAEPGLDEFIGRIVPAFAVLSAWRLAGAWMAGETFDSRRFASIGRSAS